MATIDVRRQLDVQVTERLAGLTVREVYQQVCLTRAKHCGRGRRRAAPHGRRRRHWPVSHYRAVGHSGLAAGSPDTFRQNDIQRRTVVLTLTVALGLLYLGMILVLGLDVSNRLLLPGAFLIAGLGAVVLNAITVAATDGPVEHSDH